MTSPRSPWRWKEAVRERHRATARWGVPDSGLRAEGHVIGFSQHPMVLIETDSGEQVWWAAELCDLVNSEPDPTTKPWHTSDAERAVCQSLPGGCTHPDWRKACCGIHWTDRPHGHCDWTCCEHEDELT